MNPMKLLQLKSAWEQFRGDHPKFPKFLTSVYKKGLAEGTLVEIHVTLPNGEKMAANIKLKADDIALIKELEGLLT